VFIAGGGPVGLSLAVRLGQLGVPAMLAERRPGTTSFPKARMLSTRTMEIYRGWELAGQIAQTGLAQDNLGHYTGASLTAADFVRVATDVPHRASGLSPTHARLCSQDRLEPLLRAHAQRLQPERIRFGVEMVDVEVDDDGVTVRLLDHEGGVDSTVRADYLIAADGAHSPIRKHLGISTAGHCDVSHHLTVLFDADLRPYVHDRLSTVYTIDRPDLHGTFVSVDNGRRWQFSLTGDRHSPPPSTVDDEGWARVIRDATGLSDLDIRVVGRQVWRVNAQVADAFIAGRVLLLGDAAHVSTPYGGFGLDCGIADVDNVAWKLAAVSQGWGGPRLLPTYHDERRPVALATVAESQARFLAAKRAHEAGMTEPERPSDGLLLGYRYHSSAIIDDGTPSPDVDPVTTYVPTARPGHHAPHLWLDHSGQSVSILDVLGPGLTLFAGPRATEWVSQWQLAAAVVGIPVTAFTVAAGDPAVGDPTAGDRLAPDEEFLDRYGLTPDGGVLVRPDGHVAWRSASAPAARPEPILAAITGR
jgi:putative polyketide hydroxylase